MNEIRSHPDLYLFEHLAEIRAAAKGIFGRHGTSLFHNCPEIATWFDDAVALHDTGKSSPQFQAYIPAPEKYRGCPRKRPTLPFRHFSPFTMARRKDGIGAGRSLSPKSRPGTTANSAISAANSRAASKRQKKSGSLLEEYLVDSCEVLEIEIPEIDHDALQRAVGLTLPRFNDLKTEDAVDEARDLLKFDFRENLDLLSQFGSRPLPAPGAAGVFRIAGSRQGLSCSSGSRSKSLPGPASG